MKKFMNGFMKVLFKVLAGLIGLFAMISGALLVVGGIILTISAPFVSFAIGFYLAKLVIYLFADGGIAVAEGLNLLFNTTRFYYFDNLAGWVNQLPLITGALAFVGTFFKSSMSNIINKKEKI